MKEGAENAEKIEFVKKKHTLVDFLKKLQYVEKITCDETLEYYIILFREEKGFLPRIKEVNRVPIKITQKEQRDNEKLIRIVMDKIWMHVGTYRLVTEEQMDEVSKFTLIVVGIYLVHG